MSGNCSRDRGKPSAPVELRRSSRNMERRMEASGSQSTSSFSTTAVPPDQSTPEDRCSICLGPIDDPAHSDGCGHTFCFVCLSEWAKLKHECPMCKKPFTALQYKFRNDDKEFDIYVPEPIQIAPTRRAVIQGPAAGERAEIRRQVQEMQARLRNFDEATRSSERIQRLDAAGGRFSRWLRHTGEASWPARIQEGRRRLVDSIQLYQLLLERTDDSNRGRIIGDPAFRRLIYERELELRPPPATETRERQCSPRFFRRNEAMRNRLAPWLTRELNVLLLGDRGRVEEVVMRILLLVQRFHIPSVEFARDMIGVVPHHAHFVQELHAFARSPYELMEEYDEHCQYIRRGTSTVPVANTNVPTSRHQLGMDEFLPPSTGTGGDIEVVAESSRLLQAPHRQLQQTTVNSFAEQQRTFQNTIDQLQERLEGIRRGAFERHTNVTDLPNGTGNRDYGNPTGSGIRDYWNPTGRMVPTTSTTSDTFATPGYSYGSPIVGVHPSMLPPAMRSTNFFTGSTTIAPDASAQPLFARMRTIAPAAPRNLREALFGWRAPVTTTTTTTSDDHNYGESWRLLGSSSSVQGSEDVTMEDGGDEILYLQSTRTRQRGGASHSSSSTTTPSSGDESNNGDESDEDDDVVVLDRASSSPELQIVNAGEEILSGSLDSVPTTNEAMEVAESYHRRRDSRRNDMTLQLSDSSDDDRASRVVANLNGLNASIDDDDLRFTELVPRTRPAILDPPTSTAFGNASTSTASDSGAWNGFGNTNGIVGTMMWPPVAWSPIPNVHSSFLNNNVDNNNPGTSFATTSANSYWPTTSATATATVQSPLTFSSTFRPITSSPSSVSSLRLDNGGLSSDEEIAEADGSDVEVLAVLKPRHLRTPPLVELDDEKTEDNEGLIAVSSGEDRKPDLRQFTRTTTGTGSGFSGNSGGTTINFSERRYPMTARSPSRSPITPPARGLSYRDRGERRREERRRRKNQQKRTQPSRDVRTDRRQRDERTTTNRRFSPNKRRRGNDDDPSNFDVNRVAILHRDQQQQPGSSTKTATSTVRHRDGNSSDDETVGYDRYHANARSRLYSDDDDRDSGW